MKIFLFRLSRVLCFGIFSIVIGLSIIMLNRNSSIYSKFYSEGFFLKSNNIYIGIEAPKGEMGIFLTTNNDFKPYRCKIRAPGFFHLNAINSMVQYHTIADAVVIIGTQDIVFGEVDR